MVGWIFAQYDHHPSRGEMLEAARLHPEVVPIQPADDHHHAHGARRRSAPPVVAELVDHEAHTIDSLAQLVVDESLEKGGEIGQQAGHGAILYQAARRQAMVISGLNACLSSKLVRGSVRRRGVNPRAAASQGIPHSARLSCNASTSEWPETQLEWVSEA
jgi:hypothetical protein